MPDVSKPPKYYYPPDTQRYGADEMRRANMYHLKQLAIAILMPVLVLLLLYLA